MKQHTLTTYSYDELNQAAKDKAVWDEVQAFIEAIAYDELSPAMRKVIDDNERTQTPWFVEQGIYFNCRDEIEDCIRANEYEYYSDGTMFVEHS